MKRWHVYLSLGFLLWGAVLTYSFVSGKDAYFIQDIFYMSTPLAAVGGGIFALKQYGFSGPRARTLILICLGIFSWWIGEMLWDYYDLILHTKPFPTLADFFYIIAYPLIFIALVNEIRSVKIAWSKIGKKKMILYFLCACAIAIAVGYFLIFQAYDPTETLFTNIIAVAYGVGDLLLVFTCLGVIGILYEYQGGKIVGSYMAFLFGILLTLAADILFALFTDPYEAHDFMVRNFLDFLWISEYLSFAYALFDMGFLIRDAKDRLRMLTKK